LPAAFLSLMIAMQQIPTDTEWTFSITNDDFTDKVETISALVVAKDNKSVMAFVCSPDANFFTMRFLFLNEYLGSDDDGRVRWRIGSEDAQEEEWDIDGKLASNGFFMTTSRDSELDDDHPLKGTPLDPVNLKKDPLDHPLVNGLLTAPDSATKMIFEVTDYDYDRHRGEVTLKGSKDAVRRVIDACKDAVEARMATEEAN